MEHLNEHMDELFRSAAASYRLREVDSNWDLISGRLNEKPSPPGKKKYVLPIILLALLFLLIASPTNWYRNILNRTRIAAAMLDQERTLSGVEKEQSDTKPTAMPATKNYYRDRLTLLSASSPTFPAVPATYKKYENGNTIRIAANDIFSGKIALLPAKDIAIHYQLNEQELLLTKSPALPQSRKQFYWGFTAAAEANTVGRFNHTKPGFSGGFVLGFPLSDRWSLESGLLISSKKFMCDGKAFDMKKLEATMPPAMKLEMVESSNKILEVPLRLRYKLSNTNNAVSLSAGIISIFQSKETNDYHASINGNKEVINAAYQPGKLYAVSTIQLGVGKDFPLGTDSKLRLEPYVKIPVRGMGMGNVPVNSAGIQLTFLPFNH